MDQQRMEISFSEAKDLPRLFEIWQQAVKATHHFLTPQDYEEISQIVQGYLKSQKFFVVREGSLALGFMGMSENKIDSLFVDPKYHGKKVGSSLVQHAKKLFAKVTVDVNEQNEGACGFYLKHGFQIVSRSELDGLGKPYPLLHLELISV